MARRTPTSGRSPQLQSDLRFITATNEVAQHPSAGVALVGATELRHLQKGVVTPEQVVAPRLVGNRTRLMVGVTAATHNLVGAYGLTTASMMKTVPFAYDGLVMGSFITAAGEFSKGRSGEVLPNIDVPTPEQVERFTTTYHGPTSEYVRRLGSALSNVAVEFTRVDGEAQDPIDKYHDDLLAVSAAYADDRANPARFGELDAVRAELGEALTPIAFNAILESGAEASISQAGTLAENIVRSTPSQALLGKYMGPPQA
ncbi:MAG TPA: hypothetical protein VLF62_04945 [Candidatus Saccharimonadales bacterium]|nr:hypothetical protein [Candidatus Saccharimonadales bacterium]